MAYSIALLWRTTLEIECRPTGTSLLPTRLPQLCTMLKILTFPLNVAWIIVCIVVPTLGVLLLSAKIVTPPTAESLPAIHPSYSTITPCTPPHLHRADTITETQFIKTEPRRKIGERHMVNKAKNYEKPLKTTTPREKLSHKFAEPRHIQSRRGGHFRFKGGYTTKRGITTITGC